MIIKASRKDKRHKRHFRVRLKIKGTELRPRLAVFTSNKHQYAQLIDDNKGHTLLYCSTVSPTLKGELKSTWTREAAKKLGEILAKEAVKKGIKEVVFDRGGNRYHGKISALAESAREHGLEF